VLQHQAQLGVDAALGISACWCHSALDLRVASTMQAHSGGGGGHLLQHQAQLGVDAALGISACWCHRALELRVASTMQAHSGAGGGGGGGHLLSA